MKKPEVVKSVLGTRFNDYFQFIKHLGEGSFGKVVLARDKISNESYAVKIIDKKSVNVLECDSLCNEAKILASLKHSNIVDFIDVIQTETKIYIVMNYVKEGYQKVPFMIQQKGDQPNTSILPRQNAKQSQGNLFQMPIECIRVHPPIEYSPQRPKASNKENILIKNTEDLSTLQIADFGLSTAFGENNLRSFRQQCGTIVYMAPEQLTSMVYSKPVDIWSAGIIMYKLLVKGNHPFYQSGDSIQKYKEKIKSITRPQLQDQLSESLISRLLSIEPSERYSASQALNHPWITGKYKDEIPLTVNQIFKSLEQRLKIMKIILQSNILFITTIFTKQLYQIQHRKEQENQSINIYSITF